MKKSLRSAYISEQKTKSVYFKLRPLPPLSYATAEYCLYTFLFLGSEGGHGMMRTSWYLFVTCVPGGYLYNDPIQRSLFYISSCTLRKKEGRFVH